MSERIRAVDCPSCGAPLDIPAKHERLFKCSFCGTTLEDQSTPEEQEIGEQPKITIHSNAASSSRTYLPPKARTSTSSRSGWVVLALIIGFAAISIIIPLILTGVISIGGAGLLYEINTLQVYSFGPTQLLPSDDDTSPDVVAVTYNSDETNRMIYVDFDAQSQLRWRSEALGEDANYTYNQITASDAAIFLAYETTLVAFDRADGHILWEQTISDEVSNICQNCLQIFEQGVVTLSADGTLSSYDIHTGAPAWDLRLNETTRQLLNLDGNIAVLDKEDDAVGINVYAPETGTRIQRIVPECPNETFANSPQTLGIYDPVLLSEDGKNIYVPISSYDPGCLQKWDAASLTQYWEASIPRDVLDNFRWEPHLLTAENLFLSDGNNLYNISLLDGSYQRVYSAEDYNIAPLSVENRLLLTLAERTRGTRKYTLWGLDTAGNDRLWEFAPTAEEIIDEGSSVVYDTGIWSANMAGETPLIFEAFSEPGVINFSVLDPDKGTIASQNSLKVNNNDYSYWMQLISWQEAQVYLAMDDRLWWIDASTGNELAVWP